SRWCSRQWLRARMRCSSKCIRSRSVRRPTDRTCCSWSGCRRCSSVCSRCGQRQGTSRRRRAVSVAADLSQVIASGRRVLRMEADALRDMEQRVDDDFVAAATLILDAPGRVIVSGIGKSGIIARKIAATLTSTGTPAFFLHPVEGLHGDLGIVSRDDVAILLSKSGESSELTGLIEYLKRLGVRIIALTGRRQSTLGRSADVVLDCSVAEEACPFDLAP